MKKILAVFIIVQVLFMTGCVVVPTAGYGNYGYATTVPGTYNYGPAPVFGFGPNYYGPGGFAYGVGMGMIFSGLYDHGYHNHHGHSDWHDSHHGYDNHHNQDDYRDGYKDGFHDGSDENNSDIDGSETGEDAGFDAGGDGGGGEGGDGGGGQ